MRCSNCGRERPRTGDCPHCGAEAGNSFAGRGGKGNPGSSYPSSGAGDRSSFRDPRNSSNPRSSQTPSRPQNDPRNSSYGQSRMGNDPRNASQTPSRPRPGDWGSGSPDQSYARRNPSRPLGNDSYVERGLIPQMPSPNSLMTSLPERSLPSLPSEEEERAMGIRRPAFIPATEERKGRPPTRWRVISGVASILLLCAITLGASGLLLNKVIMPRLIGVKLKPEITPVIAVPTVFLGPDALVTPAAKPNPAISYIKTAKDVSKNTLGNVTINGITPLFYTNDNIFVVLRVEQSSKSGDVISVHWIFNNTEITDSLKKDYKDCCNATLPDSNPTYVIFQIGIPEPGIGHADVYYNGQLSDTLAFDVIIPSNTPTPIPTATVASTATPKK